MKLFTATREAFNGLRSIGRFATKEPDFDPIQMWMSGQDTAPGRLVESLNKPFTQHPAVSRGVKVIAQALTKPTLEVRESADEDAPAIPDHWLPALLATPAESDVRRGTQLLEAVGILLMLRGEALIWHRDIRRGEIGTGKDLRLNRPQEIQLLERSKYTEEKDRDGRLKRWSYSPPVGGTVKIPIEESTFLREENPYDSIRGIGRIEAALLEASTDYKANIFNRSLYANSAIPPILFKMKGDRAWPEAKRERFLEVWDAKLSGPTKAGQSAALPPGVETELLKISHIEMAFIESKRLSRENIVALLGVPPILAGYFDEASLANAKEAKKIFFGDTMVPLWGYVATVLTVSLLQRYEPGRVLRFKTEPILAEIMADEFAKKVELGTKLWAMGFPATDVNDRLELGFPTDGPTREHLSVGFLPISVAPAADVLEPDVPDDEVPDPDETPEPPPEETPDDEGKLLFAEIAKADATLVSGLARQWGALSRRYHRAFRAFLGKLKQETLANLKRGKSDDAIVEKATVEAIVFDGKAAAKRLVKLSDPFIESGLKLGAESVIAEAGLSISFDFLTDEVVALQAAKRVKLVGVSNNIRKRVRKVVAVGISEGDPVRKLAQRIREQFKFEQSRALTTARTEMSQSFVGGRFNAMKQNGVKRHTWLASRDQRVRDTHARVNRTTVAIGKNFANGVRYPGDFAGPPEEVINCRCTVRVARKKKDLC